MAVASPSPSTGSLRSSRSDTGYDTIQDHSSEGPPGRDVESCPDSICWKCTKIAGGSLLAAAGSAGLGLAASSTLLLPNADLGAAVGAVCGSLQACVHLSDKEWCKPSDQECCTISFVARVSCEAAAAFFASSGLSYPAVKSSLPYLEILKIQGVAAGFCLGSGSVAMCAKRVLCERNTEETP